MFCTLPTVEKCNCSSKECCRCIPFTLQGALSEVAFYSSRRVGQEAQRWRDSHKGAGKKFGRELASETQPELEAVKKFNGGDALLRVRVGFTVADTQQRVLAGRPMTSKRRLGPLECADTTPHPP